MEIKEQLKEHRARLGLSQEELADRIFVSRQTISNWETDRTYPDVQSLLLMSDLFGTSIDELVKGDVATMEKTIENEWKTMSRLAMTAWVLVGVGIACVIAGMALPSGPSSLASGFSEGEVLGIVLFDQFNKYLRYERAAAMSFIIFLICSVSAGVYIYTNLREKEWEK